ncbi:MAG: phospholipid carrier-dependent glycosyltransferase [Candidatus Promineifilaceae bacterium]
MNARSSSAPDLSPARYHLLAAALLLLMFGLALGSLVQKAPTFDEQGFVVRGLAALRGYPQIRVGHPIGLNALNASLLAGDESVALPTEDASWGGTGFHRPAELFLWEIGNDVAHVMFLARLPTVWLGLLLAALAARWTRQLARRRWAALLALAFVALDPNILAHTRLATTDLGLAAFALLASYTLWRFLRAPAWLTAAAAGVALGLLQNTKFTALLFVPLFGLVVLIWLVQTAREGSRAKQVSLAAAVPWRALLLLLTVYPLAALLALWAGHGFETARLPSELPSLSFLGGLTLPLAGYVEQLADIGGRLQVGTPSFLLGQYSDSGWWTYFPIAFLLKTPLPTLLLLAWGAAVYVARLWRRRSAFPPLVDSAVLLVPALGYFAIALTSEINLGYRHLLPMLPPLIVFAVSAATRTVYPAAARKTVPTALLVGWLAAIAFFLYPDYLAFFNLLAGGPDGGWRALVDSNLDWGQDLDDLAPWMAANDVDEVWLSYFGEARPAYYGVAYRGLDSFPPRLMDPAARPFYPPDPAPGVYAISATNLQGVQFADHDQFAWFRERQPLDKLGYSIFLYEVPARGEPAALVLAGLQMDELTPEAFARLGGNDLEPRWVDPAQALIIPGSDRAWLARPAGTSLQPLLANRTAEILTDEAVAGEVALARYNAAPFQEEVLARFSAADAALALLDIQLHEDKDLDPARSGVTLLSVWRQDGQPRPLQLFVHALDADGRIVAQWDGLGAAWQGWLQGDRLLQVQELSWPESAQPVTLVTGVYDPQTGERWQTDAGQYTLELP